MAIKPTDEVAMYVQKEKCMLEMTLDDVELGRESTKTLFQRNDPVFYKQLCKQEQKMLIAGGLKLIASY